MLCVSVVSPYGREGTQAEDLGLVYDGRKAGFFADGKS